MSKDVLIAIAGGLLTALLYLSTETGNPATLVFAYFTLLPLFMVGLADFYIWMAASGQITDVRILETDGAMLRPGPRKPAIIRA